MKKFFILAIVVCLGAACISDPDLKPMPNVDNSYLVNVMDTPLTFLIPKDKAEDAWSRIHLFIAKYATLKIHTSTQDSIETSTPQGMSATDMTFGTVQFSYSAARLQKGAQFEVSVLCDSPNMKNAAARNAHILAYYALTGELIEKHIRR